MYKEADWAVFTPAQPVLVEHSLACLGAGRQAGTWRSFSDRTLPHYGAVLVEAGSGHYFDSLHPTGVRIIGPSLIWLTPGHAHGYGPDKSGWTEHWILFEGCSTSAYEHLGVITREQPVQHLAIGDSALRRAVGLFSAIGSSLREHTNYSELRASALVHALLVEAATWKNDPASGGEWTGEVMSLLAQDALLPLTVAQRARRLGLSLEQLRNLVLAHTGKKLLDHVLDIRITKAQELLAATTQSVQHIGRTVGFDDPAYFSRVFAHRVGLAPSSFRRQQARNVDA